MNIFAYGNRTNDILRDSRLLIVIHKMKTEVKTKQIYLSPETEVLEFKCEGIICESGGGVGDPGDFGNGGDPFNFGGAPIFF